jgi:hypothetical protein
VGGRYVPESISERAKREPCTNPKPNHVNNRLPESRSVGSRPVGRYLTGRPTTDRLGLARSTPYRAIGQLLTGRSAADRPSHKIFKKN